MTGAAAWVADRPIPIALVDARVAALRGGRYAARLPHASTAEGRNLRRWLTQTLVAEAVVEHEAGARGLRARDAPAHPLSFTDALRTGGVTAAIVAAHPLARALREHLFPPVPAPDEAARAYYERNVDLYAPAPYPTVRDRIARELGLADRDRRFARWFDERCAALVRLAPGYEHPGDPSHPDASHRH